MGSTSRAGLFISHSSKGAAFVRQLQQQLEAHQVAGWIDSRQLRGGDVLWPALAKAIEAASCYLVVVSPAALQSKWVGKELKHALAVQQTRQATGQAYPVVPLSLDGTQLGVLEEYFADEPIYIQAVSSPGGVEAALDPILMALGLRLPADVAPASFASVR